MTSEYEKMLAGEWYDANTNLDLTEKRMAAQDLCFELNQLKPSQRAVRREIEEQLFGQKFDDLVLLSPFINYPIHLLTSVMR